MPATQYDSFSRQAKRLVTATCAGLLVVGCAEDVTSSGGDLSDQPASLAFGASGAFSDEIFLDLVGKHTKDGGDSVDYAAWQASTVDMTLLDEHIAAIGEVSPKSHPQLFQSKDAQRRYWINAYNALVLDSVLDLWPLESVRNVHVSLTSRLVPGKGFFYDREVLVGGERFNLLDLEKEILKDQQDPRLHFALNCASDSCPVLRTSDWSDEELDRATSDFISNPANVFVDESTVHLSAIFKWYRDEFPPDLYGYLQTYASPELRAQLAIAIERNLPTLYIDYDWSLNSVE